MLKKKMLGDCQDTCKYPGCNVEFVHRNDKSRYLKKYPSHKPSKNARVDEDVFDVSDSEPQTNDSNAFNDSIFNVQNNQTDVVPVANPAPALINSLPVANQQPVVNQPVANQPIPPAFVNTKTVKNRKIVLDVNCEQFMQLGFILVGSVGNQNTSGLVSALSDKCVEFKLDESYIRESIETLQMLHEFQASHFRLEKSNLNQFYGFNTMTANQKKTVEDLATLQINDEAINKELNYAEYYHKYVKLMSAYSYGSNNRSLTVINAVIDALSKLKFDEYGRIHPVKGLLTSVPINMLGIGVCIGILLSVIFYFMIRVPNPTSV